jgi:hypothetical protein
MNEQVQRCIKECLDCHSLCLETLPYCLQQGGRHAQKDHIRLLIDWL